ncbi:hypothetical protein MUK42_36713 [Musa troglodytarum]|uniref:Uncharacterized protein n=1 Tax=Musa troglodytarum TaxID=320322 RepID=A0A9E7G3B5_9LILI|nr:hypothetical protein MUK42_36713 [Musa troglodytarum]
MEEGLVPVDVYFLCVSAMHSSNPRKGEMGAAIEICFSVRVTRSLFLGTVVVLESHCHGNQTSPVSPYRPEEQDTVFAYRNKYRSPFVAHGAGRETVDEFPRQTGRREKLPLPMPNQVDGCGLRRRRGWASKNKEGWIQPPSEERNKKKKMEHVQS